jgi:hypothetical protein
MNLTDDDYDRGQIRFGWGVTNKPKMANTLKARIAALENDNMDDNEDNGEARFYQDDLIKILPAKGQFEFQNRQGFTLVLTRKAPKHSYHFDAF